MTWFSKSIFLFLLAAALVACNRVPKANTPEAALDNYVHLAFSAKNIGDKKRLMEMSTGDALAHLEKMKDEEFKKQFLDAKLQLVSLRAKDLRKDNENGVSLVYELSFRDGAAGNNAVVHTNKKIAYLVQSETKEWKIRATQNIKSYIEKKEDLVITPETTNKNSAGAEK